MSILKHRKFTYKEERLNRMSQDQLTDYLFMNVINEDKLEYVMKKRGIPLSRRRLRKIKVHLEMKQREELPREAYDIIDTITQLKEDLKIFRQSEIVAITMRYLDNITKGTKQEQAIEEATVHHIENWELSMERLHN